MDRVKISIQERTENFAIRIVKVYCQIKNDSHFDDAIMVLAKQLLRSGTSIGANVAEAKYAQSNKDFIHKYSIALKEASESRYWIQLMIKSEIIPVQKMKLMLEEVTNIINILTSIIKKLKAKER